MVLRYVVLGLALLAICVWSVYLLRCKGKWLYALAPMLWLGNATAFWVYRLCTPGFDVTMVNSWSVGVYLHAMLSLLAMGSVAIGEASRRQC
jgi:hypothetical protein